MDRTRTLAGGAMVSLATWLAGCGQAPSTIQSAISHGPVEPAQLDLTGVTLSELRQQPDGDVVRTAFPWSSKARGNSPRTARSQQAPTAATPTAPVIELPTFESEGPILPSRQFTPEQPPEKTPSPVAAVPLIEPLPALVVQTRSAPLASAVERADELTRTGLSLAQRGALFSARSEFMQALRTIATAQDELQSTNQSTRSLNAGLRAMEESRDFDVRRAASADVIDVAMIVAGHHTDLLKQADTAAISPATARDRYQSFACDQLVAALGGEKAGSMAMYGLGRISAAHSKTDANASVSGAGDALVWYQAALAADASNFRAAHELGSLYAHRGEWHRAREVFQRAVAVAPHPVTWNNLAVVHEKLGEQDLAAAAKARAVAATDPKAASGAIPPIKWVDSDSFAKSTAPNEVFFPQQAAQPPATQTPPASATRPVAPGPRSASKSAMPSDWRPFGVPQRR